MTYQLVCFADPPPLTPDACQHLSQVAPFKSHSLHCIKCPNPSFVSSATSAGPQKGSCVALNFSEWPPVIKGDLDL